MVQHSNKNTSEFLTLSASFSSAVVHYIYNSELIFTLCGRFCPTKKSSSQRRIVKCSGLKLEVIEAFFSEFKADFR